MTEVLRRDILLHCPPARAFRAFTEHVDLWWPQSHRRHGSESRLTLEPVAGGRLVDWSPHGEWTMATVASATPPSSLTLLWFPGSPVAPTHVEISFVPTPEGTLVTIVHTAPSAAAEAIWPERVALFSRGWEAVLPALKAFEEGSDNG